MYASLSRTIATETGEEKGHEKDSIVPSAPIFKNSNPPQQQFPPNFAVIVRGRLPLARDFQRLHIEGQQNSEAGN